MNKIIKFIIILVLLLAGTIYLLFHFEILVYIKPIPQKNPPLLPYYIASTQREIDSRNDISFKLIGLYSQFFYPFKRYAMFALINNTDYSIYLVATSYNLPLQHPDYAYMGEEVIDIVDYNNFLIQEKLTYDMDWHLWNKDIPIQNTSYKIIELKSCQILFLPLFFPLKPGEETLNFRYCLNDILLRDVSLKKELEKYKDKAITGPIETGEIAGKDLWMRLDKYGNTGMKCFYPDNLSKLGHTIYDLPPIVDLDKQPIPKPIMEDKGKM